MIIEKGEKGIKNSWQGDFPTKAICSCGGEARIAFVAQEEREESYVCDLHKNKPGEMWLHDAMAVAVYFCKNCLQPVTFYNQA